MSTNREPPERQLGADSDTPHSNFVAHLGHDLRSPLNGIIGFSRLLKRQAGLDSRGQENLEKVLLCADQLLVLIDRMVDLAKLESGTISLNCHPTALDDLLNRVRDAMHAQASAKGIELRTRWETLPQSVLADEERLAVVLKHLLDNAIKCSDGGTVDLRVSQKPPYFRFEIEDRGQGIEADKLQAMMASFSAIGGAAGSGLGIAICKASIELMGGVLEGISSPGRGTCFWFDLALSIVDSGQSDTMSSSAGGSATLAYAETIPAQILGELRECALVGDVMGLLVQLDVLAEDQQHADFVAQLSELAKSFQVNKICELLDAGR